MTLVSLPSPILWPGIQGNISNTPAVSNLTALTASGHFQSYVFCAREDMTISHVAFRIGSATSTPNIDARIETVANTGIPTGTLWATNTNLAQNVAPKTKYIAALTASASITKGQVFAVKLANTTANSATPQSLASIATPHNSTFPYSVLNTGSDSKTTLSAVTAMIGMGSSSTTFYHVPGAIPPASVSAGTFNNTNGARRGLRFTLPMSCRAVGLRFYATTSVGDFNAILFNDAGTELSNSSTAFDGNYSSEVATGTVSVYFDNAVSLTVGQTYRLVVEPSSATNVNVSTLTLASANYRGGTPAGTTAHYTTFASSAWDDTNTAVLPLMDLIIDQIDDGNGTGGVIGVIGG